MSPSNSTRSTFKGFTPLDDLLVGRWDMSELPSAHEKFIEVFRQKGREVSQALIWGLELQGDWILHSPCRELFV